MVGAYAQTAVPGPVDLNLVDVLRAAHVDAGRWLSGWTVTGVSTRGRVAVSCDGQQRIVSRADVLPVERPCLPPRAGDPVQTVARRDALDESGSFWFTYGGTWDEAALPPELVRLYWHVPRRSTPALVRSITDHLGRTEISYALKIAVEDRDVDRPDRAVLYVGSDVADAGPAVRAAYAEAGGELCDPVPRLSERLARGLAVAEDPANGESFGENRCRLIADGLAGGQGGSRAERVADVLRHLGEAGLDPARPHLRPGSSEDYRWLTP